MSQNSKLIALMQTGATVTPAQAFELCGTLCLHSRAAELRSQGWLVVCVIQRIGDKNVGVYSLPESCIKRVAA